ncbi:MAG: type II toxin-antitoxin system VapC family toxin, partial [Bacteroidales bacterium]
PGPALAFLEAHEEDRLYITFTIAGELAAGVSLPNRARWEDFLAPFHVLRENADVSWEYGRAWRHLHDNNLLIGTNDIWIAATGLAYGMPVVTRNARHYRRIPGLQVAGYLETQ